MTRPHLLVVTPDRVSRHATPAIIAAAASIGVDLTVASYLSAEDVGIHPNVTGFIQLGETDGPDAYAHLLESARAIHGRSAFTRAVTFAEGYVESVAAVNQALALGGTTPDTARRCRDKYLMRQALAAGGVAVPGFWCVRTAADFRSAVATAVARSGFPCISKPSNGSASDGVIRIDGPDDVDRAYEFTRSIANGPDGDGAMLLEEYVSGPEVSVEGIAFPDRVAVAGVTQKTKEPEPFFNEIMHVHPAPLPPATLAEIEAITSRSALALGLREGGVHLEARLTARGPVVMECAARLPGDGVPIVVRMATGINLYECVLGQAAGLPMAVTRTRRRVGGIRFIGATQEGVIRAISLDHARLKATPGIVGGGLLCGPGVTFARAPRGDTTRVGFAMAVGASAEAVTASLLAAEVAFTVDVVPFATPVVDHVLRPAGVA